MRFTVFTPTYNRGYIIEKLYRSLRQQTFLDFEWIVVDDGSTDNTEELFAQLLLADNFFPIRYVKTENGGKHRAINQGVSMAVGELFFIVDSDDCLPEDALQAISEVESTIPEGSKHLFCGVCGQKGYIGGGAVGSSYEGEMRDLTMLERTAHGISGDKAEVFYTPILRRYPFPEFPGEKFMTECVVWDKIAADGYKMRFFNRVIYLCEYLPDGLTAHESDLFRKNPGGHGLYLAQSAQYKKIVGLRKWNQYYQFYRTHRSDMSLLRIAKYLRMNPFVFFLRMMGMNLFYKLYD